jgi:hypothetical protein
VARLWNKSGVVNIVQCKVAYNVVDCIRKYI